MSMQVDIQGSIVLSLQVAILFLLILGLPLSKRKFDKTSLIRHGYLAAFALILHTILILTVMIPSFATSFGALSKLTALQLVIVWSHVTLAGAAEILGAALVFTWLLNSPSKMRCMELRRWMAPIFILWAVSVLNGALIYLLGII